MCMYNLQTQNAVQGLPNLSLPDICTNSPLYGKAFCKDHCDVLEKHCPEVPLEVKAFLKYCGMTSSG